MKKTIISIAAVFALFSCNKNVNEGNISGQNASIYAYDEMSRTVLNPDWSLSWTSGDNLTVFNAEAGSATCSDNCRFFISGEPSEGKFTKDAAESSKMLVGGKTAYDWYVVYPWLQYASAPGGTKGYTVAQTLQQVGYGNSSHIAAYELMAGKAEGVADGTAPVLALKHLCTLMKFTVVNKTGGSASISSLTIDASEGSNYVTGSFSMDWNNMALDPTQMGSSKSYLCQINVMKNAGTAEAPSLVAMDETIENGASVDFYMVLAPFTIPAGKTVKITITGSAGILELSKTAESDLVFEAGKYNEATLEYANAEYVVFSENFGANTVKTANIPSYKKTGLTTMVASHKSDYTYAVYKNASIQLTTTPNGGIKNPNYVGSVIDGAALKLPNGEASLTIGNITVEPSTTYIFKYCKSKGIAGGNEYVTKTGVKVRKHGETTWSITGMETEDAGEISVEFTTAEDMTKIDILAGAVATSPSGTVSIYPALDNFKLIRK